MFKSDDLLEQLQEAGIPYELNASKPGIYIGGVFYKYGDAQEKDYELQRIVKDTTEPYNK